MEKLGRPKTETSNYVWVEIDNFLREHEQEIADDCKKIMKTVTQCKINQKILQEIIEPIKQINYGEVVITIHDSKIVQIEKKEKKRFT